MYLPPFAQAYLFYLAIVFFITVVRIASDAVFFPWDYSLLGLATFTAFYVLSKSLTKSSSLKMVSLHLTASIVLLALSWEYKYAGGEAVYSAISALVYDVINTPGLYFAANTAVWVPSGASRFFVEMQVHLVHIGTTAALIFFFHGLARTVRRGSS